VIPAEFVYLVPSDPQTVSELLQASPTDSAVLAGGTWLVPDLNCGEKRPRQIIDLASAGVAQILERAGRLCVGAMCTYTDLLRSDTVARHSPLLALMAGGITGGAQIRNRGTLGGSLAAARSGFDVPTVLAALRATVIVLGPHGDRRSSVGNFLLGDRTTTMQPTEFISHVEIPLQDPPPLAGYCKIKRSASSWPIVTSGAVTSVDAERAPTSAHVALGGVTPCPLVLELDPDELSSASRKEILKARIEDHIGQRFEDTLASVSYRMAVGPVAADRALQDSINRLMLKQKA
jgi:carbon-monoxide dehydrogenase medium subunit